LLSPAPFSASASQHRSRLTQYLAHLRAVARQKAALKSLTFELSVARRAMTSDDVRKLMKTIRQIQRDSGGRLTV